MAEKKTPRVAHAKKAGDVGAFLAELEHPRKAEIEALRALILGADERVREAVKWNAPSFYIEEHFATFKLRPVEKIQVVFHTGAKVKSDARALQIDDPAGLLSWPARDRCVATFVDRDDVRAKEAAFVGIVKQWIEQTTGTTA